MDVSSWQRNSTHLRYQSNFCTAAPRTNPKMARVLSSLVRSSSVIFGLGVNVDRFLAIAAQPKGMSNSVKDRKPVVPPRKTAPGKGGMRLHGYSFFDAGLRFAKDWLKTLNTGTATRLPKMRSKLDRGN